jgi:hypothetical protein
MAKEVDRGAGLLERAYADGELSEESSQALVTAGDIAAEVGRALGAPGGREKLLLVTILVDDSSSIKSIGGADTVRLGHNHCLDALSKESGTETLVHTRYLNAGTLSAFSPLDRATRLSSENYRPRAEITPLHKQAVITLGAVMAKVREERERARQVRAFTLLVTDGADNASGNTTTQDVRSLVRDMLEFSDDHIVAGMGIGSDAYFRPIFTAMGIPDNWILTSDATPEEIAKVFRRVAKSLQLAAGGGDTGWLQLEAGPVSGDE